LNLERKKFTLTKEEAQALKEERSLRAAAELVICFWFAKWLHDKRAKVRFGRDESHQRVKLPFFELLGDWDFGLAAAAADNAGPCNLSDGLFGIVALGAEVLAVGADAGAAAVDLFCCTTEPAVGGKLGREQVRGRNLLSGLLEEIEETGVTPEPYELTLHLPRPFTAGA
jgi:hypothetical protein